MRFRITEGTPTLVRLTRIAAKPAIERREPEVLLSCMLHAPPHVRPHTTTGGATHLLRSLFRGRKWYLLRAERTGVPGSIRDWTWVCVMTVYIFT